MSHTNPQKRNKKRKPTAVVFGSMRGQAKGKGFRLLHAFLVAIVFAGIGGTLIYFTHAATPATTNTCSRSSLDVPSCGVLWGAYVPGYNLTSLESQVGRKFDIFQEYNDFSTGTNGQIPNSLDLPLIQGGRTLLATWQPRVFSAHTNYSWSQIASGSLDNSIIIPQAKRIKALGTTKIFLAFDSEMNDTSSHTVAAYGTPAQYVAAYQHIYNVFKAQGVTNVIWVWTPTGYTGTLSQEPAFYPGDSYVDWIGYDPYNFYQCSSGDTTWKSPTTTFDGFYNWVEGGGLGSGAESKPLILDEYGSHDDADDPVAGGSNWYAEIPAALQALPKLKALSQFDSVGICTTQLSSAADIAGFAQAGISSTVLGTTASKPTPPPDTTPPSVSLTSPASGATLAGTATIDGTASDSVGVSKVELFVDGKPLTTDTKSPYNFSLDTTAYSNGSHSLYLEAFDTAGNHADSATVTVAVKNSTPAPTGGGSPPSTPSPPPTSSIGASTPPSTAPVPVKGNLTITPTSPGASVSVKVDGKSIKGDTVNISKLTNGTHVLTITEGGKTKTQAVVVHNSWPTATRNYIDAHLTAYVVTGSSILVLAVLAVRFGERPLLSRLMRFVPGKKH